MKLNNRYRLEFVPTRLIRRMPGLETGAAHIKKLREFAKSRGYRKPVILSDAEGRMTLLAGAATFELCLEENETKVPAVVVHTEDDTDSLMFALQSAQLSEAPDAIATGAAVVRLIDKHGMARKNIAKALGKSRAWINRMENLSRRLNGTVQSLVAEGLVSSRAAQEIARLPEEVQTQFAISTSDEFMSKENVAFLVNRYLNEDTGAEERDRIIGAPGMALPYELKRHCHTRTVRDNSDSARLARAIAGCMDAAAYLSRLLVRITIDDTAVRISDVDALSESLTALRRQLQTIFPG